MLFVARDFSLLAVVPRAAPPCQHPLEIAAKATLEKFLRHQRTVGSRAGIQQDGRCKLFTFKVSRLEFYYRQRPQFGTVGWLGMSGECRQSQQYRRCFQRQGRHR
jgi:hypothetical protein